MQKSSREYIIPYIPHAAQMPFHQDRYKVKFRLLRGGTGSGKTVAGVFEILSWLLENAGAVGYIFEPTYKMVPRILIKTLHDLLGFPFYSNPIISDYNKGEHRIDLANKSQLWFGGLEDPEMAEGPNIDIIQVDEARLIRHFDTAWLVIQRRIRGSIPGKYPTGAFVTTTPDAPGSPLHKFFDNPETRNPMSKSYNMTLEDNIHLTKDYIENIKRTHHGGLSERFVYGRFAAIGAGTIPFDYSIHVKTIDWGNIKEVVYGVDFGWDNPSCILPIGFDRDGRAYIPDEYYMRRQTPDQVITEAKRMQQNWGHGTFIIDPTEKQTIQGWNAQSGIRAVKSEPRRDESVRNMAGYFPVDSRGIPRIFISPTCVNLIAELQGYDESIKENDHAVDALRYGVGSKMKRRAPKGAWKFG